MEYRYPLLRPVVRNRQFGCQVASLPDLAAMKLAALAQRGAKKDFVDVYALAVQGFSLAEILEFYREKYSVTDVAHVLYSLTYFGDAERDRMPRMLAKIDWRSIKRAFTGWVQELTES